MQGQTDKAMRLVDIMIAEGCTPDNITYGSLINGFYKQRNMDEAMSLFRKMPQVGLFPGTVTYTIAIGGLCKVGRRKDAQSLFNEMQNNREEVPNNFTYNTLIDALCKS